MVARAGGTAGAKRGDRVFPVTIPRNSNVPFSSRVSLGTWDFDMLAAEAPGRYARMPDSGGRGRVAYLVPRQLFPHERAACSGKAY